MAGQSKRNQVYEIVTQRLIEALEQGTVPWRQPWKRADMPRNLVTKQPYRGSNVFALLFQGYRSPFWCTFKQALALGGHVKKGEKGTPIVFWRWITEQKQADGTVAKLERAIPHVRYYTVFNVEQCQNLTVPVAADAPKGFDPIAAAEQLVADMPQRPKMVEGGEIAAYAPARDVVMMPARDRFYSAAGYYGTLFHELTHSTAHESRLARKASLKEWTPFGSPAYSQEELVAEMGASFLLASCDLVSEQTIEHSAAYLENWLKALKADPAMLLFAGAQAQKAADFISGAAAAEREETATEQGGDDVVAQMAA
jgi:antirestriction protein ArdC